MKDPNEPETEHPPAPPSEPTSPGYYCAAKTRDGTPCRNRAGFKTIHPGEGRCRYHGGLVEGDGRLKHGMHSQLAQTEFGGRIAELLEQTDSPVEEMRYTATLMRAVAEKFLAEHVAGQDVSEETAKTAIRLLDFVSRAETRISKARDRNSVDQEQVQSVVIEVVQIVRQVAGEETAQRVGERLLEAESEVIEEGDGE